MKGHCRLLNPTCKMNCDEPRHRIEHEFKTMLDSRWDPQKLLRDTKMRERDCILLQTKRKKERSLTKGALLSTTFVPEGFVHSLQYEMTFSGS